MNPIDKAKELVKKFDELLPCEGTTTGQTPIDCALILVNEILENGGNFHGMSFNDNEMWIDVQFWESVKSELERL